MSIHAHLDYVCVCASMYGLGGLHMGLCLLCTGTSTFELGGGHLCMVSITVSPQVGGCLCIVQLGSVILCMLEFCCFVD